MSGLKGLLHLYLTGSGEKTEKVIKKREGEIKVWSTVALIRPSIAGFEFHSFFHFRAMQECSVRPLPVLPG